MSLYSFLSLVDWRNISFFTINLFLFRSLPSAIHANSIGKLRVVSSLTLQYYLWFKFSKKYFLKILPRNCLILILSISFFQFPLTHLRKKTVSHAFRNFVDSTCWKHSRTLIVFNSLPLMREKNPFQPDFRSLNHCKYAPSPFKDYPNRPVPKFLDKLNEHSLQKAAFPKNFKPNIGLHK